MTDQETEQQRQWSDALSAAWERHRERLFEGQRATSDWLIDHLDPQPRQTILELAAGPGETGFLAAEKVGPDGKVLSTDVGEGMVAAARRGVEARGLTNVECRLMDAQDHDLDDASVDGVLCRFGIMLVPEPDRALAEARRVLKPGGRLAYAVWGAPDRNPWLMLLAMAILENGHQPPGNPFEAGGPFSLAEPDRNRELMATAGFGDVVVEEIPSVFAFESFDDYWQLYSEISGPLALLLSTLTEGELAAVRDTASEKAEPFRSGDGAGAPSGTSGSAGEAYEFPSLAIGVCAPCQA